MERDPQQLILIDGELKFVISPALDPQHLPEGAIVLEPKVDKEHPDNQDRPTPGVA